MKINIEKAVEQYNNVEKIKKERDAYYTFIMTLIANIENEFQKDGWCKLVITKEKLNDIKKFMESINAAQE